MKMKKPISLIFLSFNFVSSVDVTDTSKSNWCWVPKEYCTGDQLAGLRCDVPLGWSCGNEGILEPRGRAMTETVSVTVTATEPTFLSFDGLQVEFKPRGLVEQSTITGSDETSINPEEAGKILVSTTINPFGESPELGVGGWMTGYSTYHPSSTKPVTFTPLPSLQVRDTNAKTANDEASTNCPPIKPILEVSCVDRSRLLWNDFKITWGPAWNDQPGCRRLYKEMGKRGLVTGFRCSQIADQESNTWVMEARGHRPRFPSTLVADAIRATFGIDNTIYYRGYETRMLCEKVRTGGLLWK